MVQLGFMNAEDLYSSHDDLNQDDEGDSSDECQVLWSNQAVECGDMHDSYCGDDSDIYAHSANKGEPTHPTLAIASLSNVDPTLRTSVLGGTDLGR